MAEKILISGGTGLVGSKLIQLLNESGQYDLGILTRSPGKGSETTQYGWDIKESTISNKAFPTDHIIHLAGAGVADERWTEKRKKQILDSRVDSTRLFYETFKDMKVKPKTFVSASAIGFYGYREGGDHLLKENDDPGQGFLAEVTERWEEEIFKIRDLGIRTVALRIGIVLSEEGGALPKIVQPIKFGVGAPLGSGKQFMSWIHIHDLARMFREAIENPDLSGIYNAVAPNPVTNKEFTKKTAEVLSRPLILPNVPKFVLNIMLGEMAEIVTEGSKVSCEKIAATGFRFEYPELGPALVDLLKNS